MPGGAMPPTFTPSGCPLESFIAGPLAGLNGANLLRIKLVWPDPLPMLRRWTFVRLRALMVAVLVGIVLACAAPPKLRRCPKADAVAGASATAASDRPAAARIRTFVVDQDIY